MASESEQSPSAEIVAEIVEDTISNVEAEANAAIERAEARAKTAEAIAEAVTDAALQTTLATRVDETERRIEQWAGDVSLELSELRQSLSQFQIALETMQAQLTGMLIAEVSEALPVTEQSLSNPETLTEVPTVQPEAQNLSNAVEENPEAKIVRKLRRWI
jgi:hypothetical protein